jgi:putative ABC transport system ATP-binding protein
MFVSVQDVTKTYRLGETRVRALDALNLEVPKGEFMAIVGASGSGKSTLFNMIGCLDRPDSGKIIIDGVDVGGLNENDLSEIRSRKLGIIFQSFNLMPVLNVFENVELPLFLNNQIGRDERQERVTRLIHDVGLDDFVEQVPDQLSGGQRQRVAIARALVNQPSLVLADEPTANLDSKTAHKIIDLMHELNQKTQTTFLFSTHDEKLIDRVRSVARIEDGRIINPPGSR